MDCFYYYILLILFWHIIDNIKDKVYREYLLYIKSSNNNLGQTIIQFFNYSIHTYYGAFFEELVFRLPYLCYKNIYLYYILNIIFALQHYSKTKINKYNMYLIVYTFILGIMFTDVGVTNGFLYSVLLHLINNFLASFKCFVVGYKSKILRKLINS